MPASTVIYIAGHKMTADLDLYLAAARQGQAAVNFNHLIEANRASD